MLFQNSFCYKDYVGKSSLDRKLSSVCDWCIMPQVTKGRFTRYDFVAYDKLTTRLRHELLRVNQTYNSLNGPKSCRRPVVSLAYATKSYRVNRP